MKISSHLKNELVWKITDFKRAVLNKGPATFLNNSICILSSPEADLELLQYPRWSTLQ